MAKRRANGEGHIYKKENGKWGAMFLVGYKPTGSPDYKHFTGETQRDAINRMNVFKELFLKGKYIKSSGLTIEEWLDDWYENYSANKVKISTRVNDESIIKNYLKPNFGKTKLDKLKGKNVQSFYNDLQIKGRMDGREGGLSPKTIRNIHITFRRALEQAVKEELIFKNPLSSVSLPRVCKKEIEILTPVEQKDLVRNCNEHPWGMAIILTLYSGVRMGELLGLTWKDVDFEANTIRINKQLSRLKDYEKDAITKTKLCIRPETKTKSSNRVISIVPVIMNKLNEYKIKQEEERKEFGNCYNNFDLVFCRADGWYADPGTFREFYLDTLKKSSISHKTFHALRHTFATRALESGSNIKVVSEILGHSSIQITLDTYSHVSRELQEETMQRIVDNFLQI